MGHEPLRQERSAEFPRTTLRLPRGAEARREPTSTAAEAPPTKTMTLGDVLGPSTGTTTLGEVLGERKPRLRFLPPQFGIDISIPMPEAAMPIFDFAEGFNLRLAQVVAAPIELVDKALRIAGVSLLEEPGNATQAVIDAFEFVGIQSTPIEGLAGEIGREAFDGMVTLAAITLAAPVVVAKTAVQVPTVAKRIANDMARFFIERPGLAAATEAGAVVGAVVGERAAGAPGRVGGALVGGLGAAGVPAVVRFGAKAVPVVAAAMTGGFLGGVSFGAPGAVTAGGLAAVGAKKLVDVIGRTGRRIFGREVAPEAEPILRPPREGAATSAAAEIVERDLVAAEGEIAKIMASLPEQTPDEVAIALRAGLDRALRVARTQESAAFSEGFLEETTTAGPLLLAARTMSRSLKVNSPATPTAELARIKAEFIKRRKVGKLFVREPKEVAAREIQDFRSDLLNAARNNAAGPNPSRRLVRNLNILADAALDSLRSIDEIAVDNALTTSRRLNALFFRGPMGRVMRRTTAGEPTLAEEATTETLLRRPRGFRQIEQIAEEFGAEELKPLTTAAIRAMFRAEAERGGQPAAAFLRKNKSALESFANESIKLQGVADELAAAQAAKLGAQKGALARFAAQDPEIGIRRIFSSANPAETAAQIRGRLTNDPDALAGFETDFLAELFRRNGYSAQRLKIDLGTGKISRLVDSALPEKTVTRLRNVVNIAADVEAGKLKIPGVGVPVLGPVLGLTARVVGAMLGRKVSVVAGQRGTIQTPGAFATFSKSVVQRMTGKIDPAEAFALTITDPAFEKVMLTQVPTTAREVIALGRAMRLIISAEVAVRPLVTFED